VLFLSIALAMVSYSPHWVVLYNFSEIVATALMAS